MVCGREEGLGSLGALWCFVNSKIMSYRKEQALSGLCDLPPRRLAHHDSVFHDVALPRGPHNSWHHAVWAFNC